jgi:hypothetical protein
MFYRNNGDGSFTRVTTGAPATDSGSGFATAWGDINNDGFQDLVVTHWRNEVTYLYRNGGNTNHWLTFELEGRASNRSAIGAKIQLKARIGGVDMWQLRHISGGDGLGTQNDLRPSFGLRDASLAETVRVEWPSGIVEELTGISANQFVNLKESDLTITPRHVEVTVGEPCVFTASISSEADDRYQWFREGTMLPNETNLTLVISSTQAAHGGAYFLQVTNPATGRFIQSMPAVLIGPVVISRQPQPAMTRPTSNVVFEVTASGQRPLTYQWLKDGVPWPDATNAFLSLPNVRLIDEAVYSVSISNSFGAVLSSVAPLVVLVRPVITIQPLSQSAPAGGSVTFSVSATGNPLPLSFRWRRGSTTFTNITVFDTNSFFTITDVQATPTTNQFVFTVGVTNLAGISSVSSQAVLTVLADDDHDGLPDEWESAHGLDAAGSDADSDGHSNLAEYLAGTDPQDPADVLSLKYWREVNDQCGVSFMARAARTYSLQSSPSLEGPWTVVRQFPAFPASQSFEWRIMGATNAFYRLRSPGN